MCLAACYWASVSKVVFAATSHDLADYGFRDLAIYGELALRIEQRSIREEADDDELRQGAVVAVRDWAQRH
jgi:guanine deaminase